MIEVVCPQGHRLQIAPENAAAKIRCSQCGEVFQGPGATPAPAPPRSGESSPAAPLVTDRRPLSRRSVAIPLNLLEQLKPVTQLLLFGGLVLVLGARGCDSIANRYVARAQVAATQQENEWRDDWQDRFDRLDREEKALREKRQATPADAKQLDDLRTERRNLEEARSEDQQTAEVQWKALARTSRDAHANNQMWGFWREIAFMVGTLVLSVGLLAAGFTMEGPGRWICMVMLAIVIFSLYVGGVAWVSSMTNLMRG